MGEGTDRLAHARELHRQSRWDDACVAFLSAGELAAGDLELLAEAAQLTGLHQEAVSALERAFTMRASEGDLDGAATDGFWLYTAFVYAGEVAAAGGWVARISELAEQLASEAPGWLAITAAQRCIGQGRHDEVREVLAPGLAQARARGNVDLESFALMLTARSLLLMGRFEEGMPRLDDVMLRVTGGKVSPRLRSILYCAGIGNCEEEAYELARAQEWARSLEAWMASLPGRIGGPFLNHCRVYRAVLRRRRGQVQQALGELEQATRDLTDGHGVRVAGHACYELAETHRLLGDDERAEDAYRRASGLGGSVHPGLALLRLRQGDTTTALSGLRRALTEAVRPQQRCRLLPALITALIAADASSEAQEALTELSQIAAGLGSSALDAEYHRARGEISLAGGQHEAALPDLRRSADAWRRLGVPYEAARTATLISRACRGLGDDEGARLELEFARDTFAQLGASTDAEAAANLLEPAGSAHGLTQREVAVLRLVAAGGTNATIANQLFLSERTVHRHVSNIFNKLGVRTRTEAAAYAVRHQLIRPH